MYISPINNLYNQIPFASKKTQICAINPDTNEATIYNSQKEASQGIPCKYLQVARSMKHPLQKAGNCFVVSLSEVLTEQDGGFVIDDKKVAQIISERTRSSAVYVIEYDKDSDSIKYTRFNSVSEASGLDSKLNYMSVWKAKNSKSILDKRYYVMPAAEIESTDNDGNILVDGNAMLEFIHTKTRKYIAWIEGRSPIYGETQEDIARQLGRNRGAVNNALHKKPSGKYGPPRCNSHLVARSDEDASGSKN